MRHALFLLTVLFALGIVISCGERLASQAATSVLAVEARGGPRQQDRVAGEPPADETRRVGQACGSPDPAGWANAQAIVISDYWWAPAVAITASGGPDFR